MYSCGPIMQTFFPRKGEPPFPITGSVKVGLRQTTAATVTQKATKTDLLIGLSRFVGLVRQRALTPPALLVATTVRSHTSHKGDVGVESVGGGPVGHFLVAGLRSAGVVRREFSVSGDVGGVGGPVAGSGALPRWRQGRR